MSVNSVQLLSHVQLFASPWIAACQASLSITSSQSLLKLMSIKSVMPFNTSLSVVPFSSCLQCFPASGCFLMIQFFTSGGQSIGVSASASVLPMNTQDWSSLERTVWISLQSKGLSKVFSSTTVQGHQFVGAQPFLLSSSHIYTWLLEKTIALSIQTFVGKVMSLLFNTLSKFVIAFLPRSKTNPCISL